MNGKDYTCLAGMVNHTTKNERQRLLISVFGTWKYIGRETCVMEREEVWGEKRVR